MTYDGASKILSVDFNGTSWIRNVKDWVTSGASVYAILMSASTGTQINLQQFKINSLTYTASGVTTNYVDNIGNSIASSVFTTDNIGASYTTEKKNIAGYTYKRMASGRQPLQELIQQILKPLLMCTPKK